MWIEESDGASTRQIKKLSAEVLQLHKELDKKKKALARTEIHMGNR